MTLENRLQKRWEKLSEEEKESIEARYDELREDYLTLQRLREKKEITQEEIAEILGICQSNVSRMEKRKDHRLSTMRDYIEALGGKLQIAAVFPDDTVYSIEASVD